MLDLEKLRQLCSNGEHFDHALLGHKRQRMEKSPNRAYAIGTNCRSPASLPDKTQVSDTAGTHLDATRSKLASASSARLASQRLDSRFGGFDETRP